MEQKLIKDLADTIASDRITSVENEFFEELSDAVGKKYFETPNKGGSPYFKTDKNGINKFVYKTFIDSKGKKHYYTLKRGMWEYKKAGTKKKRKYVPKKGIISKKTSEAIKLFNSRETKDIFVKGEASGYSISLKYKSGQTAMYENEYEANVISDGLEYVFKEGKMSKLEKDVISSIGKWASKNNLKVFIYNEVE